MNYRKIYEEYHGAIPTDENGKTYDIHHKDGNRANNCIENLIAVSLEEHLQIHRDQKEYFACFGIQSRIDANSSIVSALSSYTQLEKIKNGTHHFLNKEHQRKAAKAAVASGKLPPNRPIQRAR